VDSVVYPVQIVKFSRDQSGDSQYYVVVMEVEVTKKNEKPRQFCAGSLHAGKVGANYEVVCPCIVTHAGRFWFTILGRPASNFSSLKE